jgi:hypothetical protein
MTRYEFTTDELTKKAFAVYSDSSFTFWKDGDVFFYSDNPNSSKVKIGTFRTVCRVKKQVGRKRKMTKYVVSEKEYKNGETFCEELPVYYTPLMAILQNVRKKVDRIRSGLLFLRNVT